MKGFIALYKGTNVYLIEESEYETHLKNPAIIYMVYREGSLLSLLIQADQIIGYSDQYHNLYFTLRIMEKIREAIKNDTLLALKEEIFQKYGITS